MREYIHLGILFRQILDYPDYWVSQCGKILSTRRRECVYTLKPRLSDRGYLKVGLYPQQIGSGQKFKAIHRIVYETWVSKLKPGYEINHIDGNKLNNKLTNLEACTRQENMHHAFKLGLSIPLVGGFTGSKITALDAHVIREMKGIVRNKDLAIKYNVSPTTICDIQRGKTWKQF